MKNIKIYIVLTIATILSFTSCVRHNYEVPKEKTYSYDYTQDTSIVRLITIADLKKMYFQGRVIDTAFAIKGSVISDDTYGNFYKKMIIQDATGGIEIEMEMYDIQTLYPVGEEVCVKCKNLVLSDYHGAKQLNFNSNGAAVRMPQNVVSDYIIRTGEYKPVTPKVVKISELTDTLVNTLVKLENVEFIAADTSKTYADLNMTVNRTLQDFDENTIIVRNSGYASFYNEPIPKGNGSITAVFSVYGSDKQLFINNTDDVEMTGARIVKEFILDEGFTSNINSFSKKNVSGSKGWYWSNYDSGCAVMNGYGSDNEDWFISPALDLNGYQRAVFSFRHAVGYFTSWDDLTVWVSDDYDGVSSPVTNGTWKQITEFEKPTSWTFVNSGSLSLNDYLGSSQVYIAFKYTSTSSAACAWEIGEVKVAVVH